MKLMLIIVHDDDADGVTQQMINKDFRVTRMASTGGFLRRGNSTLLVGVEDDRVEMLINLLRETCRPAEETERRATIFIVNMNQFVRI